MAGYVPWKAEAEGARKAWKARRERQGRRSERPLCLKAHLPRPLREAVVAGQRQ